MPPSDKVGMSKVRRCRCRKCRVMHHSKIRQIQAADVAVGSKCEELNLSKSGPLYPPPLGPDLDEACGHFPDGPGPDSSVGCLALVVSSCASPPRSPAACARSRWSVTP